MLRKFFFLLLLPLLLVGVIFTFWSQKMDFPAAQKKLISLNQEHLLRYYETLSENEQKYLLAEVEALNPEQFSQQQALLTQKTKNSLTLSRFDQYAPYDEARFAPLGQELITAGKVGCLIVAGGQGTRLGYDGPKGTYPLTEEGKTLFQLFSERIHKASKKPLPVAIMTSPLNHAATTAYFAEHDNFHLESLSFFQQGMLPFLDTDGNLFLKEKGEIARGPDGNGNALTHFVQSGIWKKWKEQGVEYVNFIVVDNALADPFDPTLIGYHAAKQGDVVIKCIERIDPQEKVGVIGVQNGRPSIIEYSEFPEEEKEAHNPDGTLKFPCANISLFSFHMDFISKVAQIPSPLHLAFKATRTLNDTGETVLPDHPIAWKFEAFIFDVLPHTTKVHALLYPRERCFAPLKNHSGKDSPETVRRALEVYERLYL